MPFVPLGQRKPIPLILDGDKEAIRARQRDRDVAAVQAHIGATPSVSGYRFANHPQTFGQVRGPEVPFRHATSTWRPPSADPDGPANQRESEHADHGAYWEASHSLRKTRSSPSFQSNNNVIQACHPLSVERKRWEKLAHRTQTNEMKDIDLSPQRPRPPEQPKIGPNRQGLVLFPKYMLLHNCHLKMTDLQRFQREQAEEAARSAQEAEAASLAGGSQLESEDTLKSSSMRGPVRFDASWGAPKLRQEAVGGHHWAGSGMPAGRGMRTSNPFRMG